MNNRKELREFISRELVEHPVTDYMHHSRKVFDYEVKSKKEATDKYKKKIAKHYSKADRLYKKYNLQNYFGSDRPEVNAAATHILRHEGRDPEAKENIKRMKVDFKRHQKQIKYVRKVLKQQGHKNVDSVPINVLTHEQGQKKFGKKFNKTGKNVVKVF